jgi:hypothetical protein
MSDHHNKHEHKWALDEEQQFKATVRRNKLLGLWAAAQLGLSGEEAEAYAKTVVSSDFKEPGEEDVFRKVRDDFKAKGVAISDEALHHKMHELTHQVREQIATGK